VVVKEVKPTYPEGAKSTKIEGTVVLEAVVKEDGTVGDLHVVRSLDTRYDFNGEALKAAKQWTFKPGTRAGKPVPVVVTIELWFAPPKKYLRSLPPLPWKVEARHAEGCRPGRRITRGINRSARQGRDDKDSHHGPVSLGADRDYRFKGPSGFCRVGFRQSRSRCLYRLVFEYFAARSFEGMATL